MREQRNKYPFIVIAIAAALIIFFVMIVAYKKNEAAVDAQLQELAEQSKAQETEDTSEDDQDEEEASDADDSGDDADTQADAGDETEEESVDEETAEIEETYSFYQKLAIGYDVNILIVGDEVGMSTGADESDGETHSWTGLLSEYLTETYMTDSEYEGSISITNLSFEDADSYTGYEQLCALQAGDAVTAYTAAESELAASDYDLVILCIGYNDEEDTLSLYYEALIRAAISKYDCAVLSVMETTFIADMLAESGKYSPQLYTDRMEMIETLCDHYSIPIADAVYSYYASTSTYYNMIDSDGYPNNDGYELYLEALQSVIDENVQGLAGKTEMVDPYNSTVTEYDLTE